jgi:hypothetical protein
MRKRLALFFALSLVIPAYAKAQNQTTTKPLPLEEQEALENMQNVTQTLHDLSDLVTKGVAAKKLQCMKAFGNPAFCDCIAEKSPVGVDFIGYVSITAKTKQDFHYDELSSEDKELFDATRAAREKCVNWSGKDDKLKPAN